MNEEQTRFVVHLQQ